MNYRYQIRLVAILCATLGLANISALVPRNIIIATDLNDVLIKTDKFGITKRVISSVGSISKARRFKQESHMGWGEELYLHALAQGKPKLARIIKQLCLTQRVSKRVRKIYTALLARGVRFVYATNNGKHFMAELTNKLPELFNHRFVAPGMAVDYEAKEVIKKPDHRYFEQLISMLNPAAHEIVIFIDNDATNCNAARTWARAHNAPLKVIHFTSPTQLKRDLQAFGLL